MEYEDDLPDLNHWKQVMEFTVEQAALLLAGIDPFDIESLVEAKERSVPRWKQAWAHSLAIVSAIRQGVISPVVCRAYIFEENGQWSGWEAVAMKPSDRDMEISASHTIITRATLANWVSTERVQFARPRSSVPRVVAPPRQQSNPEPPTIIETKVEPLTLPYHGHRSEGLEYVEDAIKQLWSTYDEDDPSTAPTQEEVIRYLREKGAGANMADAVNLILRPANLRRGGRKVKKAPT
ncbi:hypothetical protein [Pseudomonas sp. SBB6]|uniref:hypothetical protein n=1 Tax=Pseudomonas sp. SBB6 TaxID=2962032 RepID=UPI0020B8DA93|nr:hypothetical protein [Pseudomonas sp. SBB6]MCP3752287.1 hypothetical protein [Pseudomonas sp. SBB6]